MSDIKDAATPEEYRNLFFTEEKDMLLVAKVVSLTMFLLGTSMIVINSIEGNQAMVLVSCIYGPLFLLSFIITCLTKQTKFFLVLGFTLSFLMEFVYLKTGGQEGFGIFWMCIITFFTFFTSKKRLFFLVNSFYILFVVLAFWTPLFKYCYQFSQTMRIRFPMLYMIEFVFASIIKIRLSKAEKNKNTLFNNLMELQDNLQHQVEARTKELEEEKNNSEKLLIEVTQALATTIDAKDKYTSGHSKRVAEYSKKIAILLGKDEKEQQKIYLIALLHDIGKIGVPDWIINKRDNLTDEEYQVVKEHPEIGYEILKNITTMPDLEVGVRWHHERLDGKGYPDGLSEAEIPEFARIISVADAYDAMTSNRSYRKYLPQSVARSEIFKGIGTQFAPEVAEKMIELIDADTEYTMHE
ncbi:MAG: HD-GYP domain-containing protein [Treponema sp.]|nr:HD-GYP domain-containing protein [Treponema sp.]